MVSFLEKKRRVMESRLLQQVQTSDEPVLEIYRQFIEGETYRIQREHRQGAEGRIIAHARSQMMEVLLKQLWTEAIAPWQNSQKKGVSLALVTLGGFGRCELNPFSDVDIMFLHDSTKFSKATELQTGIEGMLYLLWDMGLKIGHATRNIAEACALANDDLTSKTAFLDVRCIAGDEKLFQQFKKEFWERCVKNREEEYVAWRMEDQTKRHAQQGGSVFMQEPHIKQGCGGLRDYHNLLWLSYFLKQLPNTEALAKEGFLTKEEQRPLERAYDFLMRTRNELHFLSGRLNDKMTLPIQGKVAAGLGYNQRPPVRRVEVFMRDYYQAAKTIFFLTNATARRLAESVGRRKKWWSLHSFYETPTRATRVENFTVRGKEIYCEADQVFSENPLQLINVFLLAQQRNLILSDDLLRRLKQEAPRLARRLTYAKAAHQILFEIFSHKGQVARILRWMHQCELLGKLFPEFDPLTCLVQHEFFHRYSADEHTLMCIEQLDNLMNIEALVGVEPYQKLFKKIEEPVILYLALLLHDTGKAQYSKDHSEISALNAVRVARRMKLSPEALRTLAFLTDHHLTMSQTAQRKNLEDHETIAEFAQIVETEERLDYLMLLTYADGRDTTGGVGWSDWKEGLIWQLYENTKLLLSGSPEFEKKWKEKLRQLRQQIVSSLPRSVAAVEVEIHLTCLPQRYAQIIPERLITMHISAIHRFLQLQQQETGMLKPILLWNALPERGHSEMICVTWDRQNLFSRIAGALSVAELNILSADIFTRDDSIAVDTFRVCTERHEAVTEVRDQAKVAEVLEEALRGETFDFEPFLQKIRNKRWLGHWIGDEFPTKLRIDNTVSKDYTLLEIQTPDRPALLHDLVTNISQEGIEISFSRIETEKGAAIDTFHLVDFYKRKIHDKKMLERLRERVSACTSLKQEQKLD